eukprot:scaffold2503_cov84-Skeletonema_dohrnii-CCMP3373.AAC.2
MSYSYSYLELEGPSCEAEVEHVSDDGKIIILHVTEVLQYISLGSGRNYLSSNDLVIIMATASLITMSARVISICSYLSSTSKSQNNNPSLKLYCDMMIDLPILELELVLWRWRMEDGTSLDQINDTGLPLLTIAIVLV